jgi:hypothetical protein
MTSATVDVSVTGSPAEATAALAAMKPAPPAVDLSTPANIATMSSAQAAARLDGLKKDPTWQRRFLDNSPPVWREYNELSTKAAETGDARFEAALVYDLKTAPPFETTYDGEMSTRQLAEIIAQMRNDGLDEAHIREWRANEPIEKKWQDAAKRLRQQRFADPQYVDRWLKGSAVEKREQLLIEIILGRPIAEAAA